MNIDDSTLLLGPAVTGGTVIPVYLFAPGLLDLVILTQVVTVAVYFLFREDREP